MLIEVTQSDIDNGKHTGDCCPIALALHRIGIYNWVCRDYLHKGTTEDDVLSFKGPNYCYKNLPIVAIDFIKNFDSGNKVEPFSFDLE